MRTTVTLDPDVAERLRRAMAERKISFKEALNSAIRAGLTPAHPQPPFVQKTFRLGSEEGFRWDKALATADAIADEDVLRKLALRK
jgi:hypothetical protein